MNIKKQLNSQDMSDLVHLYDELRGTDYIMNKTFSQTTLHDLMEVRQRLQETVSSLEKILRETEEKPIKDAEGNTYIVCGSYTYFGKALKRLLSDSGEEDCSCDLVKELVNENEHLKNRVHNLQLYLDAALEVSVVAQAYLPESFSGMPGYIRDEKGSERE